MARLLCIDSFTKEPFRGNAAGVCLIDDTEHFDDARMQAIAAELRLSETAFVARRDDGFSLRWFTPTIEVRLCGHGTLASAHAVWSTGMLPSHTPARFHTRWKGELVAHHVESRVQSGVRSGVGSGVGSNRGSDASAAVALDLPRADSPVVEIPPGLPAALGADPVAVGINDLHHVVELADEATVRALRPDSELLAAVPGVEAVTVTARSDDAAFDFVSRYFAPKHGIVEDPVTGSAHTSLGPWWAQRLGRHELVGLQVSRRPGIVRVHVGRPAHDRVMIEGDVVTVWEGELLV